MHYGKVFDSGKEWEVHPGEASGSLLFEWKSRHSDDNLRRWRTMEYLNGKSVLKA